MAVEHKFLVFLTSEDLAAAKLGDKSMRLKKKCKKVAAKLGFPGGSQVKASDCNTGDLGSIPGLGRTPGEGNGNPLQYSCLENPMDGGAWWATVHRVAKSQTRLSDFTHSGWRKCVLSTCLFGLPMTQ